MSCLHNSKNTTTRLYGNFYYLKRKYESLREAPSRKGSSSLDFSEGGGGGQIWIQILSLDIFKEMGGGKSQI